MEVYLCSEYTGSALVRNFGKFFFSILQYITSQKTVFLVVTVVSTSDFTVTEFVDTGDYIRLIMDS